MSDDEYFLVTCEKVWRLSQDGKALLTRAQDLAQTGHESRLSDIDGFSGEEGSVNHLVTLALVALLGVGALALARSGRENTSMPWVPGRAALQR